MRRSAVLLSVLITSLCLIAPLHGWASSPGNVRAMSSSVDAASSISPVYQFYNASLRQYFLTISENVKNALVQNPQSNWALQGIAFYAYASPAPGTLPVYHFFNAELGGHYYTISEAVKNALIQNHQWNWALRDVAFYAYDNQSQNTWPVYNFLSETLRGYFFTISEDEKDFLVQNPGWTWVLLGISFYAYNSPSPATLPVHRFYNKPLDGYFFTISEYEKKAIEASPQWNWNLEGIGFYAYSSSSPGTLPVYHFYNRTKNSFYLTISEDEKNSFLENPQWGWTLRDTAFYAYSSQVPGTVPVYEFHNTHNTVEGYLYTTSEREKIDILVGLPDNWVDQKIAFYAYEPPPAGPQIDTKVVLSISPAALPAGAANAPYDQEVQMVASNGIGPYEYSCRVEGGNEIEASLLTDVSTAGHGALCSFSGIPSASGSYRAFFTVKDAASSVEISSSFRIAGPLDTWHWSNPLPQGNDLLSVAYGNGTYVAVGNTGTILTSRDVESWTVQRVEVEQEPVYFYKVTYGNGMFVAANGYRQGIIAVSPDGVTWSTRLFLPNYYGFKAAAYGNGRFVVFGTLVSSCCWPAMMLVATSTDGLTWQQEKAQLDADISDVAYGNGTFVAVGRTIGDLSGAVMTSPDGLIWTIRKSGINSAGMYAVVFGQGIFVATGAGGVTLTSTDGITWNEGTLGDGYSVAVSLAYGNNTFVAAVENETRPGTSIIMTSPDGINWTARSDPVYRHFNLTFGDDGFLAAGSLGTILTSPDGVSWTRRSSGYVPPGVPGLAGTAHGAGTFVAVGIGDTVLTSNDGSVWTTRELDTDQALYGVTYGKDGFVAVGSRYDQTYNYGGFGLIMTSPDGIKWTRKELETALVLKGISFGNDVFVAVGNRFDSGSYYGTVLSSSDASTWTATYSGSKPFTSVTHGNGTFVVVGEGDEILTSPDGVTWSTNLLNPGLGYLSGVTYGNGTFVAVSPPYFAFIPPPWCCPQSEGHILTSSDGISWTKSWDQGAACIAYGDGAFVAAGGYGLYVGSVISSSDGLTWTEREQISESPLNSLAYGNSSFVVVGFDGVILQSNPVK